MVGEIHIFEHYIYLKFIISIFFLKIQGIYSKTPDLHFQSDEWS
jgi:hypothetical protein